MFITRCFHDLNAYFCLFRIGASPHLFKSINMSKNMYLKVFLIILKNIKKKNTKITRCDNLSELNKTCSCFPFFLFNSCVFRMRLPDKSREYLNCHVIICQRVHYIKTCSECGYLPSLKTQKSSYIQGVTRDQIEISMQAGIIYFKKKHASNL